MPEERRQRIRRGLGRRRYALYGAVGVLATSGVGFYYQHVETAPVTGRKRFMMYSREEVRRMIESELREEGDERGVAEVMLGDVTLLPTDHAQYKLVLSIVQNVLASNQWCEQMREPAWKLTVVDAPLANAVSLPTGDVIVYKGMLQACKNDNELGLIISHEMAHVLLGHGVETLSHTGMVEFLGLFFIAVIWLFVPGDLFSYFVHKFFRRSMTLLLHNPYSRKLELEADKVGLLLASNACYDPAQAVQVWTHLPMYNESDWVQEYLDTHPCNQRRHQELTSLLPHAMDVFQSSQCKAKLGEELKKFRQVTKRVR